MDASGLVPMQILQDQHRPELMRVMAGLRGARLEFVTTTWTLYEALALARRTGHVRAVALYRQVVQLMEVHAVGPSEEAEALSRFLAWSDKSASVVDHANLLIATETDCDAILSFDDDFAPLVRQAGLRLLR